MLSIILLILKIIGIIILSIIAIILFLLCVVLFTPIRYRITSNNKEKIYATASITWLLHLVHVHLCYQDGFSYFITILGIKIYPQKEKPISKKKKNIKKRKIQSDLKDSKQKNKISKEKSNTLKAKKTSSRHHKPKKKEKTTFTFSNLYDKIKKNIFLFKKNINRIKDERTKQAVLLCKKELLHLLKMIFPRKIIGEIQLGMKDPSQTGELYGLYSACYPIHKGKISMIPNFEKEIFLYKIYISGRIRLLTILMIGLKIYFNKDIQRLIQIFKKEED